MLICLSEEYTIIMLSLRWKVIVTQSVCWWRERSKARLRESLAEKSSSCRFDRVTLRLVWNGSICSEKTFAQYYITFQECTCV